MLVYTYRGGIKTLVWTDTFQSIFLLLGVILSIIAISKELNLDFAGMISSVKESEYSRIFFFDWKTRSYFWKQFIGGMLIAVAMTGLDQNMMQKNLSCRTLADAQKNIRWFSVVLIIVNAFFLSLGALLYIYIQQKGIEVPVSPVTGKIETDKLFPLLALQHLGTFAGLAFIVGLTAATFSSADSVLTTLTTSFMIDFLGSEKYSEQRKTNTRHLVHVIFALVLLAVILLFRAMNSRAIIDTVLTLAGYTYGPLLGLFAFGLYSKWKVNDPLVPVVCLLSPALTYFINQNAATWFNGYQFGYELLLLNGMITFLGLMLLKRKQEEK
jgi:Na+/proline symporter